MRISQCTRSPSYNVCEQNGGSQETPLKTGIAPPTNRVGRSQVRLHYFMSVLNGGLLRGTSVES